MKVATTLASLLLAVAFAAWGQDGNPRLIGLSDEAYTVISAFLRTQLSRKNGPDNIRVGNHGSVIAPETMAWKEPITAHDRQWMKRELKGLRDETISSFQHCAVNAVPFEYRLTLPVEYHVASTEEASSIEELYANHSYPNTWGLLRFSCIGWNTSETQALFFFERTMCRCGVGKFVLMEKKAAGSWDVKAEMMRWIS